MFLIQISYIALLHAVASRCRLLYVSLVHEVSDDGAHLYGVEVEFPVLVQDGVAKRLFFWSP
jgi:thymidylate synthase